MFLAARTHGRLFIFLHINFKKIELKLTRYWVPNGSLKVLVDNPDEDLLDFQNQGLHQKKLEKAYGKTLKVYFRLKTRLETATPKEDIFVTKIHDLKVDSK